MSIDMKNIMNKIAHSQTINEGLRRGDLEDMVLPMVTIDEYASKLDDTAIVLGFYVHDKDAADDLNRFIQKSPAELLDTDVSPAPDQRGYYIVFVEFMNDKKIVEGIKSVIEEVSSLVDNESWQMRLRGLKGVRNFDEKILNKRFEQLRQENITKDEVRSKVMEFFKASDLHNVIIEGDKLSLVGNGVAIQATIKGFGNVQSLNESHNLNETSMSLGFGDVARSMKLSAIIGKGWTITGLGDMSLIQNGSEESLLVSGIKLL